MYTVVGNDMNEEMIVNGIDNFYLAITINNGSTIIMSIYDSCQTLVIIYLIHLSSFVWSWYCHDGWMNDFV